MMIINFDGWNVGVKGDFHRTWLEFENLGLACSIAEHYERWMNGEDV